MRGFLRGWCVGAAAMVCASVCWSAAALGAERTVRHEAVLDATVDEVWEALTTKEGVESWMVALAEIDLRPGGLFRTAYDAEEGLDGAGAISHTILSYEPRRMISFRTTKSPEGFAHAAEYMKTWTVFRLEEAAHDRTRVVLSTIGWGEGAEADAAVAFFEKGNRWTLDQLVKRFGPEESARREEAAMLLLGRLVGGEWIAENTRPDGSVFRSRSVSEWGPDGRSIFAKGWLGDARGMFFHSVMIIRRQPVAGDGAEGKARWRVWFSNVNENGDVTEGRIRLIGPERVAWDWTSRSLKGGETAYRVELTFLSDDRHRFELFGVDGDGMRGRRLVEVEYERVAEAPARLMELRQAAEGGGG